MPPMNQKLEAFRSVIRDVRKESKADIILYSGIINDEGHARLAELVQQFRASPNALLYLTTFGGDPDAAFRITRCLQRAYSDGKLTLFVNTRCKSAGALIAIGADDIVMSELSELGPLDVQLAKPDALAEQTSGLTPKQALATLRIRALETLRDTFLDLRLGSQMQITTRTALDVATQLTTGLFSKIYEQIDPMRLGEISRARCLLLRNMAHDLKEAISKTIHCVVSLRIIHLTDSLLMLLKLKSCLRKLENPLRLRQI